MYTHFNRGYLQTQTQSLTKMYYTVCSVIYSQKMVLVTQMPEPPYRMARAVKKWWRNGCRPSNAR